MAPIPQAAYLQARLQARRARLLAEGEWRALEAVLAFPHFLRRGRETGLADWLQPVALEAQPHEVEFLLRQALRQQVAQAAEWAPADWREAMRWCAWLPELAALDHLWSGQPPLPWMERDPWLAAVVNGEPTPVPWQPIRAGGWLNHWRRLWPRDQVRGMEGLVRGLSRTGAGWEARRDRLALFSRSQARTLAGSCAQLAMIALEVQRLRGALVNRLLFPAGFTTRSD